MEVSWRGDVGRGDEFEFPAWREEKMREKSVGGM